MERPPRRRRLHATAPLLKDEGLEQRTNAALDNMSVNRLRFARWWAHWALWRSNNHPQALTAAATIWLTSGRYAKSLRFAERATQRLRLGTGEVIDHPRLNQLTTEALAAGALACCHLRNDASTPLQKELMGCEAHHWFQLLAQHNPDALRDVLDEPVLRDLRPVVRSYLDSKATPS